MSKMMKSRFYYTNPKRTKSIKPLNPLFEYNFTIKLPKNAIIIAIFRPMIFRTILWMAGEGGPSPTLPPDITIQCYGVSIQCYSVSATFNGNAMNSQEIIRKSKGNHKKIIGKHRKIIGKPRKKCRFSDILRLSINQPLA